MRKAVFLDRDGVINEDVDHLNDPEGFRLLPGVPEALTILKQNSYCLVVITNQGAIAKGILTLADLEAIHKKMADLLRQHGASLDAVYYCPHHPEGIVREYSIICDCRKPSPGMITRAAKELNIDLTRSFLVGDKTSDILAGTRAGIKTALVKTGYGGSDGLHAVKPDLIGDDLLSVALQISS
jgi:D,D-heptose 1,7-bisphosphate phosphatase